MRVAGIAVIVSMTVLAVCAALNAAPAQPAATVAKPAHAAAPKGGPAQMKGAPAQKKSAAAPQAAGDKTGLPLADRVNIQFDLAWTGDYNGLINGEWTDKTTAAIKSFQKRNGGKETGTLAATERALLATSSKNHQERVGWRMVDDSLSGAQVGLPTKQVPNVTQNKNGTRWSSAQGQMQVETFRVREPGTTLQSVYEQQKKEPTTRRLEVNLLRPDLFILSGMQGLKKFYVRAEVKDNEVRGLTILYDQATEGIMDAVTVAMSSAFAPFPGSGIASLIGPTLRRKVEYGSGIVVSATGHVLTDAQVTEGCNVVEVAGFGDADRVGDDRTTGLALLRVYGASDLTPAALAQDAGGADMTLVGIADPQAQGGGATVSITSAHSNGDGLKPAPQLGFAGAAAVDAQGRVLGLVTLKAAVLASAGAASAPPPTAALVQITDIRKFLAANDVTPATGRAGLDATKAAVVRVICVRR